MAAAANSVEKSEIFWMNSVSDEEQPLVFVPGVDGGTKPQVPFSLRPGGTGASSQRGTKLQVRPGSDSRHQDKQKTKGTKQGHLQSDYSGPHTKKKISFQQHVAVPTIHTLAQPQNVFHSFPQTVSETSRQKGEVSLKDLCLEDKKRIATLIEELARVSEEKDVSVQRLKDEQGNFERKIQQLEQQNLMIAQERESLQQQYKECQELLGLYQQYLSQQQTKLNQSIASLTQPPTASKVLDSEEAPSRASASRADGSLFDGSYLSLAAARAQQAPLYRSANARRGAAEMPLHTASISPDGEFISKQGPVTQRESRQPRACCTCERCQGSCHDSGCRTQQWRSDSSSCPVNCHHDTFIEKDGARSPNGKLRSSEDKEALTRPLLGHKDWEEKRHQLLLQKMQLETERERLQARLEEQEEKLSRQAEQLRQSRLDYRRIQQPTQAQPSSSNTIDAAPGAEGPSHQDLPSRISGDAEAHSAGQNVDDTNSQSLPAPSVSGNAGLSEPSRRDVTTSQARPPSEVKRSASESTTQKTPGKLDFSVVELLDIFSPVSASEQRRPGARRPKTSRHNSSTFAAPRPVGGALLPPGGNYPQSFQQDLEESQILEDIFFIC
ncbi:protein hinderin isoform X2 [Nothobranchius furzeri]|uniref:Transcript variant X2 n=2 Tax=Nothobranchius furzeri TaxID=105023 RepID=A0A9D2XW33_NOTFU|nr:protein hinderin isoform X2 [Nothobranchius furzeri]KAF7208294.1 transcript variant X2 [Nothobranchius furzeri]